MLSLSFLKNWNQKKVVILALLAVFVLGIFLRSYNHGDWLLFQLDQSRDALIISEAVKNGPGELPLLGPQASTTGSSGKLKLGPIFYYFQYGVALIFGDKPNVLAWPDLFFSIGSIFLFYYFIKNYFSVLITLLLTLLFSSSFFLIIYGRFAWNPNSIPFFLLLMLIGLLRASQLENKKRFWWIVLAIVAMSILGQLHFITFFVAPTIFIIFLLFNRKIIGWKEISIIAGIFLLLNLPIIVSEFQTKRENTKNLVESVFSRGGFSEKESSLLEKSFESVQKISFYNWLTISADQKMKEVDLRKKNKGGGLSFECSDDCRAGIKNSIWAIFLFGVILGLSTKKYLKETDQNRKNFLMLNLLLIGCSFLAITPIVKNDFARFYLVITIFSFVGLGIIFDHIQSLVKGKKGIFLISLFAIFLFGQNILAITGYFKELKDLSNFNFSVEEKREIVFPGGTKTTFLQLEKIAKIIEDDAKNNEISPVVMVADNYYARSIAYIIQERKNILLEKYFKMSDFDAPFIYKNVYYITRKSSSNHFDEEILEHYNIVSKKEAGSLVIYKLE